MTSADRNNSQPLTSFSDDSTLMAWLALRSQRNLALNDDSKSYLRENGISNEQVWTDYRLGVCDEGALNVVDDGTKKRLLALKLVMWNGMFTLARAPVVIPTYDPRSPEQPVGFITQRLAQNKHGFITVAAGIACAATVNDSPRIVIVDSPLLAFKLAQAGCTGVVIVGCSDVVAPLMNWFKERELVITAYKKPTLEHLTKVLSPLKVATVQLQPEIWKSSTEALATLGLKKTDIYVPPPPPEPVNSMLLNELAEFGRGRLKVGVGANVLKELGADNPEFVEAYELGFLPAGFRATLCAEDKRALTGEKIANCVIVPAFDEQGGVVDVFAINPSQKARTNICLSVKLAGLLAAKVATSFESIIITDSFRMAAKLFSGGQKNVLLIRGLDDVQLNAERLWKSGVRHVKVVARRDAGEITKALEKVGIEIERIRFAQNIAEINVDNVLARTPVWTPPPLPEMPEEMEPKTDSTGVAYKVALQKHDPKSELATFTAGTVTYTVEAGIDGGKALEIRMERDGRKNVDRIDLTAEPQRNRFARNASQKTEVPAQVIQEHLIQILDEVRQIQERLRNPEKPASASPMSEEERQEAFSFLKRTDLLDAIAGDMEALGWAGEERTKRLLYLVSVSRKLPMPLSATLMASSGAGKSKSIETVAELAPPEDIIHVSRLTDSALYYHEMDALRHKLLIIDEADALTNEVLVALRVLQSRGALSQSHVIRDPSSNTTTTHMIEARGPVAVLTSTAASLEEQTLSRCYQVSIDETEAQTKRILEAQRKRRADPEFAGLESRRAKILRLHRNFQRLLDCRSILIPFADRIEFPATSIKHRRAQERFLNLIEASALLHQHQRMKQKNSSGEELTIASEFDFNVALHLAAESISRECDELSLHARDVLAVIHGAKLIDFDMHALSTLKPEWTRHKFRAGLDELLKLDVLASTRRTRARRYRLTVTSFEFLMAPTVRLRVIGDSVALGETASPDSNSIAAIG